LLHLSFLHSISRASGCMPFRPEPGSGPPAILPSIHTNETPAAILPRPGPAGQQETVPLTQRHRSGKRPQ